MDNLYGLVVSIITINPLIRFINIITMVTALVITDLFKAFPDVLSNYSETIFT